MNISYHQETLFPADAELERQKKIIETGDAVTVFNLLVEIGLLNNRTDVWTAEGEVREEYPRQQFSKAELRSRAIQRLTSHEARQYYCDVLDTMMKDGATTIDAARAMHGQKIREALAGAS